MKNYEKLENDAPPKIMPRDYNEPWMNARLLKLWKKKGIHGLECKKNIQKIAGRDIEETETN